MSVQVTYGHGLTITIQSLYYTSDLWLLHMSLLLWKYKIFVNFWFKIENYLEAIFSLVAWS